MNAFSERLRALRAEKGVLQADVAGALMISPQSYSTYENGREPNYETLCRAARYFGVTTDYLMGLVEYRNAGEKERLGTHIDNALDFVGGLSFDEQKRIYSMWEASANIYQFIRNQKPLSDAYLKSMTSITNEILQTVGDFTAFIPTDKQTKEIFLHKAMSAEMRCWAEVETLYSLLKKSIEAVDTPDE